jgi:hypothetical protein
MPGGQSTSINLREAHFCVLTWLDTRYTLSSSHLDDMGSGSKSIRINT